MGLLTSKKIDSLDTLLVDQLEDLYDAEQRLVQALPSMEKAAHDSNLKAAFAQHCRETQDQITRLERAFEMLGHKADRKTCYAMKGLIDEGNEVVSATGDDAAIDAALIAAAQKTEHYEIAGYGTARTFALRTGHQDVAQVLQQILEEEKATDAKLTQLAERHINTRAAT